MMIRRLILVLIVVGITVPPASAQGRKRRPAKNQPAVTADRDDRDDEADEDEDIPRVVPVFDPGSHTRPIRALGFSTDKSRLITVGEDHTVQVWSVATGERLDILRLPGYGHEQGYNSKVWNIAAVSQDGRYVAIGGGQKQALSPENQADRAKLLVVDVDQRKVFRVISPLGAVTALAFSPDADQLAVSYSHRPQDLVIYHEPTQTRLRRKQQVVTVANPRLRGDDRITLLKYSPDGKRLLAAAAKDVLSIWDCTTGEPRVLHHLEVPGHTTAAAWSADGASFARTWTAFLQNPHGYEIRRADGTLEHQVQFGEGSSISRDADPWGVEFLDQDTLLMSLFSRPGRNQRQPPEASAIRIDWKSKQESRLLAAPDQALFATLEAVTPDREYAALVVAMGLDVLVYRVKDGSIVSRCGAESSIPSVVGWAAEGRNAGFAWSEVPKPGRNNTRPDDLQYGFDLTTMEPLADVQPGEYGIRADSLGEWSLGRGDQPNELQVKRGEKVIGELRGGAAIPASTLVPQPDAEPLVAWGTRNLLIRAGAGVILGTAEGKEIVRLRPFTVHPRDIAPSPDGRFLIVSNGTHRLCVYTTDGAQFPLLSFARVKGEWVAWSGSGYYTASPGGEKMIGWAVSNGHGHLATFHTADKFAKHFRRPDLLKRAIQLGSIEAALKQGETRSPEIEGILPPKCELKLLKQSGGHIELQASATSGVKDKPVIALRLLLDGRPMTGNIGSKAIKAGEPAEATWEFDVPTGNHELKLLARNEESSAVSDPLTITGPKSASEQSVLHRLCVGINEYQLPALNLTAATKDATDVFEALEKHCVGTDNRFGKAGGKILLNEQATRTAILKALAEICEAAKPGDLVLFHFAGHGIKQQDEYYLMTHEADPSQSLAERSMSGEDLRQALGMMECPVLLVMDACHSARGVKAFRPATDDLARNLTDDGIGVTVMAAAMAHEVASATEENGYFTAAFLKALNLEQGVPFDPYDRMLYAHHVFSVVFADVRRATKGKQNPFLNMPWTAPPIAIREVRKAP